MERIVFLDRDTVKAQFRVPAFAHKWQEYSMTQPSEVVERLQDATIAITNKVALRTDTLEKLPQLKMIAVTATGTDCVDIKYCQEKNIIVSNVRQYSTHSVSEHVFTLILALTRNLIAYREDISRRAWQKSEIFCLLDHPIRELHGSKLGIIGYGNLGQAVEKIALAFGMRVQIGEHKSAATIRERRISFEDLLQTSDVVTLHCPLTEETRNLISERELQLMKKSALLINCGRGGLVDESALIRSLQNGKIYGAGFDVLTTEPPKPGNPLLELNLPNLIVTPHNAWAGFEAMQNLAAMTIDNLEAFIKGAPQNMVS